MRSSLHALRAIAMDMHQVMQRNARSNFVDSFNKAKVTSDAIGFLMRFVFLIIVAAFVIQRAREASGLWFVALAVTTVTLSFSIFYFFIQMNFVYGKIIKEFLEFTNSGADPSYKENQNVYYSYMGRKGLAIFLIISWFISFVVTTSLFYCAYRFAIAQAAG